jgi:hypothetical protein
VILIQISVSARQLKLILVLGLLVDADTPAIPATHGNQSQSLRMTASAFCLKPATK